MAGRFDSKNKGRVGKGKADESEEEGGAEAKRGPRALIPPPRRLTPEQVADQLELVMGRNKIHASPLNIECWFPTGILPLDCGINQGLPGGRLVEFSGPERSGKSTLAAKVIAEAQARGGRGDYFDLEKGMTRGTLEDMAGVKLDPTRFKLWGPDTAEQAFGAIDDIVPIVGSSGLPSVIVLDSVPAIVSLAELLAAYDEEVQLAQEAKFLRKFCRKNMVRLGRFPTVLIVLINHLTTPFKAPSNPFEKPEPTTPGGRAPRYYSTVRLRFDSATEGGKEFVPPRPGQTQVAADRILARERPQILVWKNRVGGPQRRVKVPINFVNESSTGTRKGFDNARCCLEFLRDEKKLIHPQKTDDEGKTTTDATRWVPEGLSEPRMYWKDWVIAFNGDKSIRKLVEDLVVATAQEKWTPEENSYIEEVTELSELAGMGDMVLEAVADVPR